MLEQSPDGMCPDKCAQLVAWPQAQHLTRALRERAGRAQAQGLGPCVPSPRHLGLALSAPRDNYGSDTPFSQLHTYLLVGVPLCCSMAISALPKGGLTLSTGLCLSSVDSPLPSLES